MQENIVPCKVIQQCEGSPPPPPPPTLQTSLRSPSNICQHQIENSQRLKELLHNLVVKFSY